MCTASSASFPFLLVQLEVYPCGSVHRSHRRNWFSVLLRVHPTRESDRLVLILRADIYASPLSADIKCEAVGIPSSHGWNRVLASGLRVGCHLHTLSACLPFGIADRFLLSSATDEEDNQIANCQRTLKKRNKKTALRRSVIRQCADRSAIRWYSITFVKWSASKKLKAQNSMPAGRLLSAG